MVLNAIKGRDRSDALTAVGFRLYQTLISSGIIALVQTQNGQSSDLRPPPNIP
jgi:hypothetical protein